MMVPNVVFKFWRDVFGLGVLMEKKGEILYRNTEKRNRQIWCARIRGVSRVTPLLGNASNAAVMAAVTRQLLYCFLHLLP
jgi:hypothetical protein